MWLNVIEDKYEEPLSSSGSWMWDKLQGVAQDWMSHKVHIYHISYMSSHFAAMEAEGEMKLNWLPAPHWCLHPSRGSTWGEKWNHCPLSLNRLSYPFYSTFHPQSKCSEAKLGRACLLKSIKSDGTTWLDCAHQQSLNWIVNWTTVSTPILSPDLKMQVLLPTFIFATLVLLTKDAGAAKGGVRGAGVLRCKGVFLSYF